jgi:flagellar hook-associated protein 2
MATITSTGIGSGLDVNGIITQLLAIERQPLASLEREETTLNAKLSNFGKLQGMVSAMRDKASAINSLTMWNQRTGMSSDAGAVAVTTAAGAATGNYAVVVNRLASAQTVSSRVFAASDTPAVFGPGSLTIELGTWVESTVTGGGGGQGGGQGGGTGGGTVTSVTGFTPKAGASAVTVTLDAADDTLAEVRDKINAAATGVTATIINDATGARLAIRSSDTGAENGFRIGAVETTNDGVATAGLSALSFDRLGGASQLALNQSAGDARATINGIAVVSASNTLANVSDGVTLRLLKASGTSVEVDIATDTAAVKTAIEDFVKAFNELATFIREQTRYDEATKKAGPMQGDSLVIGLQRQLRAVINEASSASTAFGRLADIGITMKTDGTLDIKSGALDNGLANLEQLRNLLATDGATAGDSGFMRRFKDLGDVLLGVDGTFETRNESLQDRLDRNGDRQDQMEARLAATEKRLRAQYEALDRNMGQLSGLSNYMSQQLQALNNFYTARSNQG